MRAMLVRRMVCHAPRRSFLKHSQQWHVRQRQLSSAAGSGSAASAASGAASPLASSQASFLAGVGLELDRVAPRIDIQADQVQILESPKEFFDVLQSKLRSARKRIFLATLYVGKSEHELVASLRHALEQSGGELRVSVLTDALRGTREEPNACCASLLAELAADFLGQVEVRMYHTPNLTGLRKKWIPKRINEGWGLQHMKLYGIDDEIILSGANLSSDYFTNRQDRYHVYSSPRVTDYFSRVHNALCSLSFRLQPSEEKSKFSLDWPSTNSGPSPLEDPGGYIKASASVFGPLVQPGEHAKSPSGKPSDTALYPVMIVPRVVNNELPALKAILRAAMPSSSSFAFTAGYFNPHPDVTDALVSCSATQSTRGTVVTASPWANGFFGSKGVSGMLPAGYTLLARNFLKRAETEAPGMIQLREWRLGTVGRPHGWTYHAKGLWLTLGEGSGEDGEAPTFSEEGPAVSIIGSSNYTTRSYSLDTEAGGVLVTTNKDLRQRLKEEVENLMVHSKPLTEKDLEGGDRRAGLHVRLSMWIVKAVGGSL